MLNYDETGKLVTLRAGKGDLICLGDEPAQADLQVDCYHEDLELGAAARSLRKFRQTDDA